MNFVKECIVEVVRRRGLWKICLPRADHMITLVAAVVITAIGLPALSRAAESLKAAEKNTPAQPVEPPNVKYKKANPVAIVVEINGTARLNKQGRVFYEPLRVGDKLYQEEKIFVSEFSRVLLEERTKAAARLVNLPALTTYTINRSTGASDLLVRSLFPNASDIEERLANQKANRGREIRKSPLGRFDILSLQSTLQNVEASLDSISVSSTPTQFSEATALTVYDLSLLTFLLPTGRVTVYRNQNGFSPVNFQFSKPHPSSLQVSVWQESPELKAMDAFYLGPGTQRFSWKPSLPGTFALQALSMETGVRSQVVRIFASEQYSSTRLIPNQIRPNDVVVIPYSRSASAR
jgi:hypothetical protein